jgi:hypothetical protein
MRQIVEPLPEQASDRPQLRAAATALSGCKRAQPCRRILLPVPASARGSWAQLSVQVEDAGSALLVFASAASEAGAAGFQRSELVERKVRRSVTGRSFAATRFLPEDVTRVEIDLFAPGMRNGVEAQAALQPLPRWQATLRLLRDRPGGALGLLRSLKGQPVVSWPAAMRRALAAPLPPDRSEAVEYATWVELFDHWRPEDLPPPGDAGIGVLVLTPPGADAEDLAHTKASLDAQFVQAKEVGYGPATSQPQLPAGSYVALLQAGHALPAWSIALAARELAEHGMPEIAIADEDRLSAHGLREAPLFKPEPNHLLMLSGRLTSALWLIRRDVLERFGLAPTPWAEVAGLDLWLRLHEASGARGRRLPFILSHRRRGVEGAPREEFAAVIEAHLRRMGSPLAAAAKAPQLLTLRAGRPSPPVDIVIPSSLRRKHAVRCISFILRGTDYPAMKVHVGIGQPGPLAPEQREAAARLTTLDVSVSPLRMDAFNFSTVVNWLAARGTAEYILLLNDDVTPLGRDWLSWLVACLHDSRVAAAGARLLYPNGTVQHGGVLMGLGGLCEHVDRGLSRDDAGYAGRAMLAQELSAVTAACMLVRRREFEALGGLDEAYPSAFNDVDFCLRLREAGFRIAYVPQAELTHHELQTYGSHYRGDRAPFELEETARMRRRWSGVISADPFHSPNLRLEPGLEWRPAFPPRRPIGSG